jgi:fatty-acyl-CoA synthase
VTSFTLNSVLSRNLPGQGAEPGRVALVFREVEHTYAELDARAERLAVGLLEHGFAKGDRLCVLAQNRAEWFEIFFALAKIGGVIVPVNYLLKPKEVQHILDDSGARWFLGEDILWPTVEGFRPDLDREVTFISLGTDQPGAVGYEALCATRDSARPPVEVDVDDLLLLQYTSGTTGFPKGAMHTHSTILWNTIHQIPDFSLSRDDVHLVIPAMCWAAGFHSFTLGVMWAGGRIILNPSRNFDAEDFCRTVVRHRVTKTILVPSVLRRVLDYDGLEQHDLMSLNLVLSGGEPVPIQSIEEWNTRVPSCPLVQGYGMGEFPTLMLYLEQRDAVRKAGATGKPCLAAEIRVVDSEFRNAAVGEIGEIVALSPASMVGYYDKPDATAQAFVDGWMRTGDLAFVDEEGFVYMAGRAKEMIISGGLNVYPAEVERVLLDFDEVAEAAVIGEPDPQWGEVIHAFVILRPGASLEVDALATRCRDELANYKVPRRWTIRDEPLPRTTSGKIQRHLLASAAH